MCNQTKVHASPGRYSNTKVFIIQHKNYYDETEIRILGLEVLGQSKETYEAYLVPIILNKLLYEIHKNIARQYGSTDLDLSELHLANFVHHRCRKDVHTK